MQAAVTGVRPGRNGWPRLCPIAAASWLPAEEKLGPLIVRARAALSGMLHPDGEIGLFNDAWIGEAPLPDQLEARPAADGQIVLAETGYGRLAGGGDYSQSLAIKASNLRTGYMVRRDWRSVVF